VQILPMTESDVEDITRLTALAGDLVFFPGALKMGRYFGIRLEGELIAMAGERFKSVFGN